MSFRAGLFVVLCFITESDAQAFSRQLVNKLNVAVDRSGRTCEFICPKGFDLVGLKSIDETKLIVSVDIRKDSVFYGQTHTSSVYGSEGCYCIQKT